MPPPTRINKQQQMSVTPLIFWALRLLSQLGSAAQYLVELPHHHILAFLSVWRTIKPHITQQRINRWVKFKSPYHVIANLVVVMVIFSSCSRNSSCRKHNPFPQIAVISNTGGILINRNYWCGIVEKGTEWKNKNILSWIILNVKFLISLSVWTKANQYKYKYGKAIQ